MTYDEIRSHLARSERDAGLLDDLIAHERAEAVAAETDRIALEVWDIKPNCEGLTADQLTMLTSFQAQIVATIRARTS